MYNMLKLATVSLALAALVVCSAPAEARPKRSIYYAASPLVQTVPIVTQTDTVSHVVQSHPRTVVKTEQVSSADHSSYHYSQEVKNDLVAHPVHHSRTQTVQHAVAAAPVAHVASHVAAPVAHVASVAHVAPVAHVASVAHVAPVLASPYYYGTYVYGK